MSKSNGWNNSEQRNTWHADKKHNSAQASPTHKAVDLGGYRSMKQRNERKKALESVIKSATELDW